MLAESIRDELLKVFTVPQADVLAKCVVQAHDTLASRSDMHDLRTALKELAEQQKLTSAEVRELAEQQKQTSAELGELGVEVRELSVEVRELGAEVRGLSVEVRELAVQQKQTSVELRDLTRTVADLTGSVRRLDIRTNKTAGWALEWVVGNRLPAYVGREIKRCRVVGPMDLIESLEQSSAIRELTADDLDQLRRADLIATGTIDGEKIYLVGEVSFTADNDDVLRAKRRAELLRKAGERSQPFVACDTISPVSTELAGREGVWVILEGRLLAPAA
jgi:hypothetical protein